jgi:hypothetical protein
VIGLPPNTRRKGQFIQPNIPLSTFLKANMAQGWHSTLGDVISRVVEEGFESDGVQYGGLYRDGEMLTPDEANNRYSIPGLEFNEPVREGIAALKYRRKQEELARLKVLELGGKGVIRKGLGLGAAIVANNLSPIDFAFNFVPIAGMTKYGKTVGTWAKAAAKGKTASASLGRSAIAVPGAKMMAFHRMVAAGIDASVGNLILEIPLYFQNQRDQVRHTMGDVALNVAMGGAFGAGLSGMGTLFRAAARKWAMSSNLAKVHAVRQTVNELHSDSPARGADSILDIDANVARARSIAAMEKARADVNARLGDIEAQVKTKLEVEDSIDVASKETIELAAEKALPNLKKDSELARILAKRLEKSKAGDEMSTQFLGDLVNLKYRKDAISKPDTIKMFDGSDPDAAKVFADNVGKSSANKADPETRGQVQRNVEVETELARQEALKQSYRQAIDDMKSGKVEDPAKKIIADLEAERQPVKQPYPQDELRGRAAEEAELREDIEATVKVVKDETGRDINPTPREVDESGIRAGMNCKIKNAS